MSDDQAPSSSSRLQRVLFSTALFATVFLIASVAAAYTYGAIRGSASYAAGFDGTGSLQGFAIPQQVATAQARAVTPPGLAPNITAAEVPPLAASNSSGPTDNSTGSNTSSSSSIITSKAAARSSPAAAGTGSEEGPTKPAAEDVKPGWPSDSWEESGSACRNGLLAAPMKLFWKYHDDKTPGLTEAIHAGDRVYVVLSMKLPAPYFDHWTFSVKGNWSITFHATAGGDNTTLIADSLGRDGHRHTFIIHAPVPEELLAHHPRHKSLRISVEGRHEGRVARYDNVPLCLYPDLEPSHFRHLIACTEITAQVVKQVPAWVAYHALQGFQHFYIYVNDNITTVRSDLEPLVQAGLVTVRDWQWPARYDGMHQFQQAEQLGCTMRARGRARWVGLHDVDEYIQPLRPGDTVGAFLNRHSELEHKGALIMKAQYRGTHANATRQEALGKAGGGLVFATYVARSQCCEGQKMLANPRGMSYSSVHGITTGGVEHPLDPSSEIVLNHFKRDKRFEDESDTRLAAQAAAVKVKLAQLGYAEGIPRRRRRHSRRSWLRI